MSKSRRGRAIAQFQGINHDGKGEVSLKAGSEWLFSSSRTLTSNKIFDRTDKAEYGDLVEITFDESARGARLIQYVQFHRIDEIITRESGESEYKARVRALNVMTERLVATWIEQQMDALPWSNRPSREASRLLNELRITHKTFANAFDNGATAEIDEVLDKVEAAMDEDIRGTIRDETLYVGFRHPVFTSTSYKLKPLVELLRNTYSTGVPTSVEAAETADEVMEVELAGEYDGYARVGCHYVDPIDLAVFEAVMAIDGGNVMIVGPSGYGKTTLAKAVSEKHDRNYVRVNCSAIRDPEEWFGRREAEDGSTVFVLSEMAEALQNGNAVIVLDEFNRVEPWIANALMPLLDDAGHTTVHGTEFRRKSDVTVVATMNTGAKFSGTFYLDAALANRMHATMRVTPLRALTEAQILMDRGVDEKVAKRIVNVMRKMRDLVEEADEDVDVSTRTSIKVAELTKQNITLKHALIYTVLNMVPGDSPVLKAMLDEVNLL